MLMPDHDFSLLRLIKLLVVAAVVLLAVFIAYGWYTSSGRIRLEGVLANSDYLLVAGQSGRAASVEVRPGDIVINGQPLLRFDNSSLRKNLERERQKLIQLARMLPPEHIRLPDPDDPSVGNETLTRRMARKGAAERDAIRALQEASDIEASAGVEFSRASILYSQGKIAREQLERVEAALAEARERVRAARELQEKFSAQRATAETAIRRVLEYHAVSGASRIPLQDRLENYEAQRKLVEQLARSVSVAYLAAPFEGTILQVLVRTGDSLAESTPCFVLQPASMPLTLNCTVLAELAAGLAEGQRCLVTFSDHANQELPGYVAGIGPGEDPAWRVVSVDAVWGGSGPPPVPPGTKGEVLVLLREPLLTPEQIRTVSGDTHGARTGTTRLGAPSLPSGRQEEAGDDGQEDRGETRAVPPPAAPISPVPPPPPAPLSPVSPEPDEDSAGREIPAAAPEEEPGMPPSGPVRLKAGQNGSVDEAVPPPQLEQPAVEPAKKPGRSFVAPSTRPAAGLRGARPGQRSGQPSFHAPQVLEHPGARP